MISQVHRCHSTEPYFEQEIPSRTAGNVIYKVHSILPGDPPNEYVCTCPGFHYNGHCAHQSMAWADRCLWNETKGPEEQTEDQQANLQCPRCGQQTIKEMEDVEPH